MKLLHSEIDVVPGRKAQQPLAEGQVGPGSAILRVENTTNQENAYTVRLRCEEPYWRDDWYTVRALPAPAAAEGAPSTGKSDQYGPNNRWVKVYVSRGGTRDVLIAFNLPQKPDSRAGRYPFKVVVETHVGDPATGPRGRNRFSKLPAVGIVRPFYKWGVDLTPEECRAGLFRRAGEFEVVVSNEGNDWLYCDLKLPRHKDLLLEAPTVRLAVPPPEPGEDHLQRSVPLRGATRLKTLRGDRVLQALPVTAVRVHAPSVPPLPDEALPGGLGASLGAAVVATDTSEVAQVAGNRSLTYCPPVPTTLTGFIGAIFQNGKTLVMTLLGLFALLPFLLIGWERLRYQGVWARPDPQHLSVPPEGKLPIQGAYLSGSVILVKCNGKVAEIRPRVTAFTPLSRQRATIEIPKDIDGEPLKDGKRIQIAAQRLGALPILRAVLPKSEFSKAEVTVGKEPIVVQPPPERSASTGGRLQPGERFTIAFVSGPPLKGAPKRVLLGGAEAIVEDWKGKKVVATVPADAPEGSLPVTVETSDGGKVNMNGAIEVTRPTPGEEVAGGGPQPPEGLGTPPERPIRPPRPPKLGANDYLIQRDYELALREAEKLLEGNPNDPLGLAAKGYALVKLQRDMETALKTLLLAESLTKNQKSYARAVTLAGTGELLKQRGNLEKAQEYEQSARETDPAVADIL
jgi:hypothetical protein